MVNKIALYRKKLGISQDRLAKDIAITRSYLSQIENGKKKPSYDIAYKIAKALNSSIEEIFFDTNVNNSEHAKSSA